VLHQNLENIHPRIRTFDRGRGGRGQALVLFVEGVRP